MVGGHAEPVEFMERYMTLFAPGTSFKSTLESGSIGSFSRVWHGVSCV